MKYQHTQYNTDLCEITQSLNTTMALAKKVKNGTVTNAHDFVHCRDFLGDALNAVDTKTKACIYGFHFDGKKDTFIQNNLALILKFPNKETEDNFIVNKTRLQLYENIIGVKIFQYSQVDDLTYYIVASKFWLKSIFNLSLYTFMLKSLGYKLDKEKSFFNAISQTMYTRTTWDGKKVKCKTIEAEYAESVLPDIGEILPKLKQVNRGLSNKTGYTNTQTINTIHNYSGFVSLIKQSKFKETDNILAKNIAKCLE